MIRFLRLLTIDRPILSFLFANVFSCFFVLIPLLLIELMFVYTGYFLGAYFVNKASIFYTCLFMNLFLFPLRIFILIFYYEILSKNKKFEQDNKILFKLKNDNIFKCQFLMIFLLLEFICCKCVPLSVDISIFGLFFLMFSLSLSYLVLFLYWGLRDKCLKNIEIVKQKQIFEKVSSYINKQKTVIYRLFDKYQLPIFVLTNVLCSGYIFMYLIAKIYNIEYANYDPFFNGMDCIFNLLVYNYAYQIIRYILIFKVFDIYSKMESGQVVDFIKKLKTSSKCRKVTSIVLFSIDTFFILLLSRGTSCNHCFIYWIMSYFFGLMSMYFVMFYYWYLENKHKDVLAEVEVKEDTGVL